MPSMTSARSWQQWVCTWSSLSSSSKHSHVYPVSNGYNGTNPTATSTDIIPSDRVLRRYVGEVQLYKNKLFETANCLRRLSHQQISKLKILCRSQNDARLPIKISMNGMREGVDEKLNAQYVKSYGIHTAELNNLVAITHHGWTM